MDMHVHALACTKLDPHLCRAHASAAFLAPPTVWYSTKAVPLALPLVLSMTSLSREETQHTLHMVNMMRRHCMKWADMRGGAHALTHGCSAWHRCCARWPLSPPQPPHTRAHSPPHTRAHSPPHTCTT